MTNTQQEYLKSLLAPLGFADKLKNFWWKRIKS